MKKTILSAFAAIIGLSVSAGVFAADAPALADRHAQLGVKCEQCHKTAQPAEGAKVKNEACFECHENYESLAKKTEKLDPNPHKTHLGNVRCSDCHKGHSESVLMCNDCHKFDLKVK
jgi:hypothetical protein